MASPELSVLRAVKERWTAIRDEAAAALRARPDAATLRLLPEPDGAALAPATVALLADLPGVVGAAFAVLAPGARSTVARSASPYLTALLCLSGGAGCHVTVEGTRHDLRDGELVVFEHGAARAAANDGPEPRVALLLLLDPAAARPDRLKALAARAVDEIFGQGRLQAADELFDPTLAPEVKRQAATLRAGFPDLEVQIEHVVAEGARVACAWRAAGTHRGPYFNVPATGARVTWTYQAVYVVRAGRIVAMTATWDMFGLLQQLRAALRA